MEQELAYSFHLGSDKNKSKVAKKTAKGNVSGTTSLSNNAIQNAKDLSKANKHNLRDYDNQRELITTIYNEQIQELSKLLPDFKIANATIHYDETSPHMHVIGVPVIDNCKRGMKKASWKITTIY